MSGTSSLELTQEAIAESVSLSHVIENDPRWQLTRSVIAGRHFKRSPLLSKFLLYVVERTLAGRQNEITEHQIGVKVFGRASGYRTVEDNIVRNYARQLRKRLAEHFTEDSNTCERIEIPTGRYVPIFTVSESAPAQTIAQADHSAAMLEVQTVLASASISSHRSRLEWRRRLLGGVAFAIYSAVLIGITWAAASYRPPRAQADSPAHPLWHALLDSSETTYIVPPDAGLNLVEDLAHRPLPLAQYIQRGYLELPLAQLDQHSADDLRLHELTDFVDMEIVTSISRLPEYNPHRDSLRFPRDLRLDDLKNSNAVILGSVCSNPWASMADAGANFTIVCGDEMRSSSILNRKPLPGEEASYVSHWNEPTHVTYALASFQPNLGGNGYMLFLEGLDVAGTQAAAETVLQGNAIASILKRATRRDGSLAPFEVLLRSTSIQSNATDTEVIATRVD